MKEIVRSMFWAAVIVLMFWVAQAKCQESTDISQHLHDGTLCLEVGGRVSCGWHQYAVLPPTPITFWTFRKSWQDPPLRSNRYTFDKKFLALHGLAAVAMSVACKRHIEHWSSEAPAVGAVTALDYTMSRFFSESMSVEAPVYAIVHYSRSAAQ